jgi:hypothetical protein
MIGRPFTPGQSGNPKDKTQGLEAQAFGAGFKGGYAQTLRLTALRPSSAAGASTLTSTSASSPFLPWTWISGFLRRFPRTSPHCKRWMSRPLPCSCSHSKGCVGRASAQREIRSRLRPLE